MASIAEWIQRIKTAIYGEEVRGAIWQSLQAMNDELTSADVTQIPVNKADIANLRTDMTAVQGSVTSLQGDVETAGAEVEDIRVGADGTVYNNAGDAVRGQVAELNERLWEQQQNVKLVKNMVTEIVVGKASVYNDTTKIVSFMDADTMSYVRVPVEGGKTYSASAQFSPNFSFWAYEQDGVEYGISRINTFDTNYVMTAPANATILYLCNTGWNADTNIVVMERNTSIVGARVSDYPFNTVVKTEIDKLTDLYNTIDVLGIEKFSKWERGSLLSQVGETLPTGDNAANMLNQRIRTPIANPIVLAVGDVLSINNAENIIYWVCHYNGNELVGTGWITADYVSKQAGDYFVIIRHEDNAELSDMTELSQFFTIERKSGIINNRVNNLINTIPYYYFEDNYLPAKVAEVNSASEILNGVVFGFVTDTHWRNNSLHSKDIIKYFIDNTTLDVVLCGGDFASLIGTSDDLKSEYEETIDFINVIGKDHVYAVRGNHDFYSRTADGSVRTNYPWRKTYNAIYRNSEYMVTNALAQHGSYCIDNDAQKTRIICVNSSDWNLTYDKADDGVPYISVVQAKWFANALIEKEGYKIIVMSHIPSIDTLTSDYASQSIIQDLLRAFVAKENFTTTYKSTTITCDFRNTTNRMVLHLSGHTHDDRYLYSDGFLSVVTTCDAHYTDDGYGATVGTITEQAFDVFCIDYDAETITAVRVGRGATRKWSFDGSVIN